MKQGKGIVLMVLPLLLGLKQTFAQGARSPETLLGEGSTPLGVMVAPSVGLTRMDGATTALLTVRGGVVFTDRLTVGGFYTASLNEIYPRSETLPSLYMDYRAGGGLVEYTVLSSRLLHLSFPLLVGVGEVAMDNQLGTAGLGERNFVVIEPSALLELNVHRFVRLNAGFGYRLISNMAYRNLTQRELSGLTGQIGLKIGLFRH